MATKDRKYPPEAAGRRCDMGCESYPDHADFSTCLVCGEPTRRLNNAWPMPEEEARSKLAHAKFEEWLEEQGRA